MTADAYLKHQSYKQCNITTDPLVYLLININKNPAAYNNKQLLNSVIEEEQSSGQRVNKPHQQEAGNMKQSTKRAGTNKEKGPDELRGNILTIHECEITRTRSRCIIKKPDRLTYV